MPHWDLYLNPKPLTPAHCHLPSLPSAVQALQVLQDGRVPTLASAAPLELIPKPYMPNPCSAGTVPDMAS